MSGTLPNHSDEWLTLELSTPVSPHRPQGMSEAEADAQIAEMVRKVERMCRQSQAI